jgi:shikimate kinase
MSGTGKSSALQELARLGYDVVDTDDPGWTVPNEVDGGYLWVEDRLEELLARERATTLYVSGAVSNQGRFIPRFDAVVLLSAPLEVLLERIARRTTNDYGKTREEREAVVRHVAEVEPLIRATCSHELDATRPLAQVVADLVAIGRG